jgi:carboxymethylenebutenolidase
VTGHPPRTTRVAVPDGEFDLKVWDPGELAPAVLVLQEIFGVNEYIWSVCERLAEAGYVAAAPDLYWRSTPGFAVSHDDAGMQSAFAEVGKLDVPTAIADAVAALGALNDLPEVAGRPGVIGFCLGGTLGYLTAAVAAPACCVSYYGSRVPSMLDPPRRCTARCCSTSATTTRTSRTRASRRSTT